MRIQCESVRMLLLAFASFLLCSQQHSHIHQTQEEFIYPELGEWMRIICWEVAGLRLREL